MSEPHMGLLLVLSGPAGVGKGTLCAAFCKARPDCFLSVSATTRKPRVTDKEGVTYYFFSEADFMKKAGEGGFLEYARFNGNYYGTPKEKVLEMLRAGRDVILEIDIQGAEQVKKIYPDGVFVFVIPPSKEELYKRITLRKTDTLEDIAARMTIAEREMARAPDYDYIVLNDSVESAVKRLDAIMTAEKCASARNLDFLKEVF